MAPIVTRQSVFLGVVVNPKTRAPIYVTRTAGYERSVGILGLSASDAEYRTMGSGYLNDQREYAAPTRLTHLPRSHTPGGVTEKGGGYGTALYTALVLLATAEHDKLLACRDLIGSGYGICSEESTRSDSASRWWRQALKLGLTEQEEGEGEGDAPETETEELTDENVRDYVSSATYRRLIEAVRDEFSDSDWSPSEISIRCDLEREVPSERRSGGEITADIYTLDSAEKHKLVAVSEVMIGGVDEWATRPVFDGKGYRDVILALNVAHEDTRMVARLAYIAKESGATEVELTGMMMRHVRSLDVVGRRDLFPAPAAPAATAATTARPPIPRRRRQPAPHERGPGEKAPVENPVPARRQNPTLSPPGPAERAAIDRELAELEERRKRLGWDQLEDLP